MLRCLLSVVLGVSFLVCLPALGEEADSPLYVRKVEGLPEDFIFGMDASSVRGW